MTDREQFEAWLTKRWAGDRDGFTLNSDGAYFLGSVQFAWEAWQAARTQPAQVPTPPDYHSGLRDAREAVLRRAALIRDPIDRQCLFDAAADIRAIEAALIAKWSKT